METGQQYLMPKNNNNNIKPKLSFHLFNDGFFFSSFTESNYFLFEDLNPLVKKGFNEFLKFNEINKDNEPDIILFDNPSMFIPSDLFDFENSENFLSNYTDIRSDHQIIHDNTEDKKIKILYQRNTKIELTFGKYFNEINYNHYTTILYDHLKKYIKLNYDNKLKLFVNLQRNQFDLFLFKGQDLLVYNSFPHSNNDDFLYYLFALIEQHDLSINSFDILFLEKYEIFKSYYLTINNFHEKVGFIENNDKLIENINHPSPYFTNIL